MSDVAERIRMFARPKRKPFEIDTVFTVLFWAAIVCAVVLAVKLAP